MQPQSSGDGMLKFARGLVYLVYAFVMIAMVILIFGFFLLLFGASPDAAFTEWVYHALNRVMAPFRGIFQSVTTNGDSVLDVSVLFAMIVYGILGMALRSLIDWLTYRMTMHQQQAYAAQTGAPVPGQPPAQQPGYGQTPTQY